MLAALGEHIVADVNTSITLCTCTTPLLMSSVADAFRFVFQPHLFGVHEHTRYLACRHGRLFETVWVLDVLRFSKGVPNEALASGGGSISKLWCRQ
jgi:hypothetical protein